MLLCVGHSVCDGGFLYMKWSTSLSVCLRLSLVSVLVVGMGEVGEGELGRRVVYISVFVRM